MTREQAEHDFWFFIILAVMVHGVLLYNFAVPSDTSRELKQEPTPIRVKLRSTISPSVIATVDRPEKFKIPSVSSPSSPSRFKALQHAKLPNRSKPLKIKRPEIRVSSVSPLQSVRLKAPTLDKSISQPTVKSSSAATDANTSGPTVDQSALSGQGEVMAGDEKNGYLALVRKMIEDKRRYPLVARRALQQGAAKIHFRILKSGALHGKPELLASSGYASLDRAALDCVQEASPFPPIPSELGSQDLELNLNIIFQLKE